MTSPATAKIPALVISGFLGSGKTSLVRHLLAEAKREGQRLAVISNEFGALGIDRELLGAGGEAFVELEGGCVCCELSNDLIETLQRLYEEVSPDRIVVETSGVALPFDTQLNFWREPVCNWIGDDMAVVVVDASQLDAARSLDATFVDQIGSADLLVLNQIDRLEAQALERAAARLQALEPDTPVVRAEFGRIDSRLLFPPERLPRDRGGPAPAARPHVHEDFACDVIELERGLPPHAVEARLLRPGLLRAKGFVETTRGLELVQVVGRRIEWCAAETPADPALLQRVVRIWRAHESG
ncbi:MAG: GTP-binding protein [Myxococcota bacterium]